MNTTETMPMLKWNKTEDGNITIKRAQVHQNEADQLMVAAFSPVSAALLHADIVNEFVSIYPPLNRDTQTGANEPAGFGTTGIVTEATFQLADGEELTACFDHKGKAFNESDTIDALQAAESSTVKSISVSIEQHYNWNNTTPTHAHKVELPWLMWIASNDSLRFCVAQSANDYDAAAQDAIRLATQILDAGGVIDADYDEIFGGGIEQWVELAYTIREIESRTHMIKGLPGYPAHPKTVDKLLELVGLDATDAAAYLEAKRLGANDPNRILLIDDAYISDLVDLARESGLINEALTGEQLIAITERVGERISSIEQMAMELIMECYHEVS